MTLKDLLTALKEPGLVLIKFWDYEKSTYADEWHMADDVLACDDELYLNRKVESLDFGEDYDEWLIKLDF